MKLLIVSMPSIHVTRWVSQLEHAGFDVYWFNVHGTDKNTKLPWVQQKVNWKLKWNYPGRTFFKKRIPVLHKVLQRLFSNDTAVVFESYLKDVQPDVVHSFALYVAATPIVEVMERHKHTKWVYSSWGSDLFYFKNLPTYLKDIKRVLQRVDYLFTDCKRDYQIAKDLGFRGIFLGVFPGGGGFDFDSYNQYAKPVSERSVILVKGYQGRSGRAIPVLKALQDISEMLKDYHVVIFGADPDVVDYLKIYEPSYSFKVFVRSAFLPHEDIMKLMGQALLYIGNSNSDGMPNTLLEAICMGAFPIQSNPGGVTEEVVTDKNNGLLIDDCESVTLIAKQLDYAFQHQKLIEQAFIYNQKMIKPEYDIDLIKSKVIEAYKSI
ncbi:glycosyltransferase [Mesoflavibacter sp. CH_XMU1404-2]|uniref:glycosyltransferase n=1 Tax=Mesoflavibacter sp. CH_XMU1404-2 TaxID=3107766 RepID=UPI00300A7959